ncbi:MAG: hypothetical protein E3J64_00030, partial [Anaerolineales bacterium]
MCSHRWRPDGHHADIGRGGAPGATCRHPSGCPARPVRPTPRREAFVKLVYVLLLFVPGALLSRYAGGPALLTFALAGLGLVPLAELIGEGTEHFASRTGPALGGFLNATLGNAAELIICIFAIRAGLLDLVMASITGSI